MNFEPQKFLIGLVDFFSVLLPGALLTYLVKDSVGPQVLGSQYQALAGREAWLVFFFSSYLLGHFIFLIGSVLLDDLVYDGIKEGTAARQVQRLAYGKQFSWWLTRALARLFFRSSPDHSVNVAARIKEHYLDPLAASSTINAFQWCKATLAIDQPDALASVHRFEADSKFFRSLVIVLLVLVPWSITTARWNFAVAGLISVLIAFAYWRYVDQRKKATRQAYWHVIAREAQREKGYQHLRDHYPTHAGGIVYRKAYDRVEYLVVEASKAPHELVLPKGHINVNEDRREAAVREVYEEAGVWARVLDEVGTSSYETNGEKVNVQYYLMETLVEKRPPENRKHRWLALDDALKDTPHPENHRLLKLGEKKRVDREMTRQMMKSIARQH